MKSVWAREYWDHWCSIWLKNNTVHGINKPLKLCVFDHDSSIPSFLPRETLFSFHWGHVGGIKPVSLKAT
jgi:hypothetical protein